MAEQENMTIYVWDEDIPEEEMTKDKAYRCIFRPYETEDVLNALTYAQEEGVPIAGDKMMEELAEHVPQEVREDPGLRAAAAMKVYRGFKFGKARFEKELSEPARNSTGEAAGSGKKSRSSGTGTE